MFRLARTVFLKVISTISGIVRFLFRGTSILLIITMLALNVASLTVESINTLFSTVIEGVTDISSLRSKSRAQIENSKRRYASLEKTHIQTKSKLQQVEGRNKALGKQLAKQSDALTLERKKTAILARNVGKMNVENKRLRTAGPDISFKGKIRPAKEVVGETIDRVQKRTAKVAVSNVGSMAGEGIPLWGIAVIVGATSYEVYSSCETMKDLQELSSALSPGESDDAEVQRVCGLRVPTKEEIWASVKSSPGKAWAAASMYISDLPRPDFSGTWTKATSKLGWD